MSPERSVTDLPGKNSWRVSDRAADTRMKGFDATVCLWRRCSIPTGSTLLRVGGFLTGLLTGLSRQPLEGAP